MESDLEAIARLIHLYAERLDAGDFEGVADLFARATFRSFTTEHVLEETQVPPLPSARPP